MKQYVLYLPGESSLGRTTQKQHVSDQLEIQCKRNGFGMFQNIDV